ncbi:unnamed protein product [Toxocara canis]|uniref:General transcription factor 3C polypeptide 5 n=1 Tax=Toxocara canis TaxID=6265 RepID=A0A183UHD7_TOXCA|nr:unnamed protein product [Toxocara canis]
MSMFGSSLPKDGYVSVGERNEYVVISYPGIVRNTAKAIEMLGGQQNLNAAHFAGRPLELRHNPDNPYCNALASERKTMEKASSSSGKILAVVKVRRKKSDPNVVTAEVMGIVSTLYTFKSMCDFQFLPLTKKNPTDAHYEDLVPRLIPMDLPSALSWWDKPDSGELRTPLFLPPYQFSRYNTPSTKILCREMDFSVEKMKKKSVGHGQSLRMERKALSVTVHADEEFPKAPTEEAISDANLRCKNEEPHRLLQELFEERPMWTRIAILRRTGLEDSVLKSLLQKYAFYILSGPWGRLWCRFGYDPRIDPKAKMYQSVMVTFRQHSKIPERQRLKVVKMNTDRALPVSVTSSGSWLPPMNIPFGQPSIEAIDYCYSPGELPRVRQMWYCICDVKLPLAEEIVRKEYFAQGDRADDQYGWLPPDAIDQIREAIKEDVKKVIQQLDEDEEIEGVDVADEDWMS